jgi:Fe-S-cluster containining protein
MEPDPLRELERQVERGHVIEHALHAEHAHRAGENEAIIRGLVELLIERGVVEPTELVAAVNAVRPETKTDVDVAIRIDDPDDPVNGPPVDCAARLHVCKAVCCRLRFPLSIDEVEAGGPIKWDLGRPYFNRHGADGYCHQSEPETHACLIYEDRPAPCHQYSCVGDDRIWKDFDAMELNQEFIDERLGTGPGPIDVFMTAAEADSPPAA